jgi:carbon storage regulator
MLVLARRVGQRIFIGDSIVLSVVRIKGRVVRIGIQAPRGLTVIREEVGRRPESGAADVEAEADADAPPGPPPAPDAGG